MLCLLEHRQCPDKSLRHRSLQPDAQSLDEYLFDLEVIVGSQILPRVVSIEASSSSAAWKCHKVAARLSTCPGEPSRPWP